jgi:hypothetical protein
MNPYTLNLKSVDNIQAEISTSKPVLDSTHMRKPKPTYTHLKKHCFGCGLDYEPDSRILDGMKHISYDDHWDLGLCGCMRCHDVVKEKLPGFKYVQLSLQQALRHQRRHNEDEKPQKDAMDVDAMDVDQKQYRYAYCPCCDEKLARVTIDDRPNKEQRNNPIPKQIDWLPHYPCACSICQEECTSYEQAKSHRRRHLPRIVGEKRKMKFDDHGNRKCRAVFGKALKHHHHHHDTTRHGNRNVGKWRIEVTDKKFNPFLLT